MNEPSIKAPGHCFGQVTASAQYINRHAGNCNVKRTVEKNRYIIQSKGANLAFVVNAHAGGGT
jgi:hypothetical protein